MIRPALGFIAVAALAFALPASATVLYSTNFAAPGFSLGALNGQGGWAVSPDGLGNPDQVVVENAVTYSGGQAVELPITAADGDTPYYAYGPITPSDPIVVSMTVQYNAGFNVPATFAVATSPGYYHITAGVRMYTHGLLTALSAGFPTIGTIAPGNWNDLSMTLDYTTQTYSISVDGALLASHLTFCGDMQNSNTCDGHHVSQFADVEFDPSRPKYSSAAYIGEVSISEVTEPDAWSLLIAGFGLAGASLRLRRRYASRTDGSKRRGRLGADEVELALERPRP